MSRQSRKKQKIKPTKESKDHFLSIEYISITDLLLRANSIIGPIITFIFKCLSRNLHLGNGIIPLKGRTYTISI